MPGKSGGQPGLYWVTSVDELPRDTSFRKITFNEFRRRYIEPARSVGTTRRTLAVAAADALAYLDKTQPLCVLASVTCATSTLSTRNWSMPGPCNGSATSPSATDAHVAPGCLP